MIIFKDGPQESQQDQTTVSLFTERLNKSTTGLVVEDTSRATPVCQMSSSKGLRYIDLL